MTTSCTQYQDDLKAYADGELSLLRRALVRRHLTHCASCREEITFMTQLTEDLRATEPEDALSPSLREKLLESPPPPTMGEPNRTKREGEEVLPDATTPRLPVSGGPLRSKEVGSKKRLIPAWAFAALALVAWFIGFPLFRHTLGVTQQAQITSAAADRARMQGERTAGAQREPTSAASVPVRVDGTVNGALPLGRPSPQAMTYNSVPPPKSVPPPPSVSVHALMAPRAAVNGINSAGQAAPSAPPSPDALALNGDPDSLRQVHKEASIGIQVPNPDATGDTLNNMVRETGGYVAANNLTTDDDGRKSGELIVKVPEAQFETFLAAVAKLGVVQSKNITGEDITEKTSDAHEAQSVEESDLAQAEARLKSLGKHATWEDKENTQDQRVKLAETRARLKLLKRMAALGTLTIDLSETPKGTAAAPPVTNGFTGTLKATTHDALLSLVGSAGALLALVIWLLAYSPIWVPLLLVGRYAIKEYRKREAVAD